MVDIQTDERRAWLYEDLLLQLDGLLAGEDNWVANLANAAALLFNTLERVNWAGFYMREGDGLVLGPFQGKTACVRIAFGKGVCGTAALTRETQRVVNVHDFPGHIACDGASLSEIVVPLLRNGEILGVLDIDSPLENRFDETDQIYLEQVAQRVAATMGRFVITL